MPHRPRPRMAAQAHLPDRLPTPALPSLPPTLDPWAQADRAESPESIHPLHPDAADAAAPPGGVDDHLWLDVIQRMDEVYSALVQDEIALEAKNEQLEQSQSFIDSVLAAMSDVLVVCDPHGRIERVNAALCDLTGQQAEALSGQPIQDLLADPRALPALQAVMQRAMRTAGHGDRQPGSVDVALRDRNGQPVPVDLNCTARRAGNGRCLGIVLVGRPMGELKRAYHDLQAAHQALQRTQARLLHAEKMASLGRLVAGIAHELNNPISFVLGNMHAFGRYSGRIRRYLDAVHAGEPLPPLRQSLRIDALLDDLPSLIEGTLEGAQRTADIVMGLRRFSAMEGSTRGPVDLSAVVTRALLWLRKGIDPAIAIEWQPVELPPVQGHAGQLQQVVMNLLQNACDALTSGQGDERSLPSRPPPHLTVSLQQVDTDRIQLVVRDNGPGVLPEHLSQVFEPFFTTKPVGKGTGLGLSISYGIVEQHQGVLKVRNVPEGGAEFIMQLPVDGSD